MLTQLSCENTKISPSPATQEDVNQEWLHKDALELDSYASGKWLEFSNIYSHLAMADNIDTMKENQIM